MAHSGMGRFSVAPNHSPTKIEMISMKKFICVFLLLYTYAATVYAVNPLLLDSIYGETPYVYDFGPEMDEEKLKQKVRTFNKNILSYITTHCLDEVLCIKDSAFVNFITNEKGRVDTVWLVRDKSFPFEKSYRFIKNYDFKGPLVEYVTTQPEFYAKSYLVKIVLIFDRKKQRLRSLFDFELIKKNRKI